MTRETDVIVIGAGPVGENIADRTQQGGLETVIIEHELVGGECSFWACIPSKVLLRSAAALRAAKLVPGAAEAVGDGALDVRAVLERRNQFVSEWDDTGGAKWVAKAGIELVRGHGRVSGERRVVVVGDDGTESELLARHAVVIATGSSARMPRIDGLAEAHPWTSREATSAHEAPARLIVIGGGVVAAEMATAYAAFGTQVTVLARSGMLGGMEPFVGDAVVERLRSVGASVELGTEPARVERRGDGTVSITTTDGREFLADEVLVATGRAPRSDGIGLETVGLEPGDWLDVDETMAVRGANASGTPWLYATGDVNHRALVTHQGKYQARAAGDVIVARATGSPLDTDEWGVHVATADHGAVTSAVFSEPEAASVGLTERAARDAGRSIRVARVSMGSVAGTSVHSSGEPGEACLIIDAERSTVIGATFVGQDVAELLHAATIAIVGEVPLTRLWHAVPAFPTMSEVWLRLLEQLGRPEVAE